METLSLILNFLGSILVAISFGKYKGDGAPSTRTKDGERVYIAYLNHPLLFRVGLTLLVFGFGLKLLEKLETLKLATSLIHMLTLEYEALKIII